MIVNPAFAVFIVIFAGYGNIYLDIAAQIPDIINHERRIGLPVVKIVRAVIFRVNIPHRL